MAALRTIAVHAQPDSSIDTIRTSLPGVTTSVQDLAKFSRSTMAASGGFGRVSELLTLWQPLTVHLTEWGRQLRERVNALEIDLATLNQAERMWDLTVQSLGQQDLPAEIQNRARANLESVRSMKKTVAERRGVVLLLQAHVADEQVQSDTILEEIRAIDKQQRGSLIAFDSVPFWHLTFSPLERTGRAPSTFPADAADLMREQAELALLRFGLFLILFFLAWLGLRGIRRGRAEWELHQDENVRALLLVVERPVSAAIFIAAMLCGLLLRDLPSWNVAVIGLVMTIPSLRLLPALIGGNLRRPFYGLMGLLIGQTIARIPTPHSFWSRVGLLVLQLAAIGFLVWLWRLLDSRRTVGIWPASVRFLTGFGLSFVAVATIANIIGMVQLAEFVTRCVLLTLYGAVIVRGMVVITKGLFELIHRSPRFDFLTEAGESREDLQRKLTNGLDLLGALIFLVLFLYVTNLLTPVWFSTDLFLKTERSFGAIRVTLYNMLAFVLAILLSFLVSSVVRIGMEAGVYRRLRMQAGQKDSFSRILHYAILMIGFLIAMSAGGVQLSNVAVLAGGLSVGLGFGLQNVLNNFVSGLILLFERPLQAGDLVKVGSTEGVVRGIGIRASKISTADGAEVIVPNGELLSGSLMNWTQSDRSRRVEIEVGAAYGADPKQVMELLTQVAKGHRLVLAVPAPVAVLSRFGDSSLDFILRFWCNYTDTGDVSSDIRAQIVEAFREAGITIPFPQRDVNLRGTGISPA